VSSSQAWINIALADDQEAQCAVPTAHRAISGYQTDRTNYWKCVDAGYTVTSQPLSRAMQYGGEKVAALRRHSLCRVSFDGYPGLLPPQVRILEIRCRNGRDRANAGASTPPDHLLTDQPARRPPLCYGSIADVRLYYFKNAHSMDRAALLGQQMGSDSL
jgi:hypothetical protein